MYQPSLFGGLEFGPSTSSAADSRVKTSVRPDEGRGLRAAARVYGEKCFGLSRRSDPLGWSLRTYLQSACEALTGCSLRWKRSATPAGHWWLVLGRSGPRTSGTEFGSWQGVNASLSEAGATSRSGNRKGELLLGGQVRSNMGKILQAPETQDHTGGHSVATDWKPVLENLPRLWPTPNANEQGTNKGYQCRPDGSKVLTLSGLTGAASPPPNWPTVHGNQGNNGPTGTELGNAVTNSDWMTPAAHEREATPKVGLRGETNPNLAMQATWPTPTKRDEKSIHASEATHQKNSRPLSEVAGLPAQENPSTPGKPRGSLNAAWVAQLMGWPDEYYNALAEAVIEYHLTAPPPGRTRAS